ncbi:MAG: 4Fe-4S binding protein [Clostridiales bacterium]|nr:4Fe-4S binding protein [Clostridiales bacterium]
MRQSNPTIAVLSGKGGTGKTLVSVNLAAAAQDAVYVDCDVEEPNGHLFFKPLPREEETVSLAVPLVDEARCIGCRACVDFCRFNALAFIKNRPVVFPSVCHACGGCALVCPGGAIGETERPIGTVGYGVSDGVRVHTGMLRPGEASGVPLIRRLLKNSAEESRPLRLIDCPPGSACAVMESVQAADYCVLVAEPTVYGAHNLAMVHELAALMHKPIGVVLNKCADGENPSEAYCAAHALPVVGRIDFDETLGALASDGKIAARESERYRARFSSLLQSVLKEARHEAAVDPQR